MLDLKRWGVRMKSNRLRTCPLGACTVAVLDNLWVWRPLARVSRWFFANSMSLHPLSILQCQIFLLSLPGVGMHQDLLWHSNHLEPQVHPSWESLLWYRQAARRTVRPPRLRGLRLVHRPKSLWCCAVSLNSGSADDTTYTSFRAMNATPCWCFESSQQYQILCPSSVVVSPKPVHLTSARPMIFHW